MSSPLGALTIVEMIDELIQAGRTPRQAGVDVRRAIQEGTIELFDTSDLPWSREELIAEAVRLVSMFIRGERASPSDVRFDHMMAVAAVRFQFEAVFQLGKAARATSAETEPRRASKEMIREEIKSVYDEAERSGTPPPNIRQLSRIVRPLLRASGFDASFQLIENIGSEREFKRRRRPQGRRMN
jgi:hypothetical protein